MSPGAARPAGAQEVELVYDDGAPNGRLTLAPGDIEVVRIPEIYPSRGERQLIWILTGKDLPSQGFPSDIGIICQNVGTAAAVARAASRTKRAPVE